VLDQESPASDREIIVVDDGSTDGTSEIAQRFIPHIHCIRKANGGQGSAFNAGIPECRGELIAFLDGDDWWDPSKLRSLNEADVMRKQKNIAQLAQSLAVGLKEVGVSADVVQTIVHAVQVEADHLRLSAGQGSSRQMVKTELAMYRLLHSDASWTHRLFKYATLLPAYVIPPRFYGALRRRLVSNRWYLNAGKVFFPVPRLRHVKRLPRTEI
jgi:glycosyltransferase involved in cell wall biosynthesis